MRKKSFFAVCLFSAVVIGAYAFIRLECGNERADLPDMNPEEKIAAPASPPEILPDENGIQSGPATADTPPDAESPSFPLPFPGPYVLMGTAPGSSAYAVIRNEQTQEQRLYRVGDMLAAAKIERIEPGTVNLDRAGIKYMMRQSGFRSGPGGTADLAPDRDLPPRDFSRPDPERMAIGWESVRRLMVQIDLSANETGGVIVGDVQADSVFAKAGLAPGDIIRSVNEREIVIEDDAMEIYECFRTEDTIRIEIVRDGRPMTLDYIR